MPTLEAAMGRDDDPRPSFAPPFLDDGETQVGQVAAVLHHLSPKLGLAPKDEADRTWCLQIQLTIADLTAEAHDVHHPVDLSAYYEDQKDEAARRAKSFREQRVPKFLDWLETVLKRNPAGSDWLVGDGLTYVDLSAFYVVTALLYAFPNAVQKVLADKPRLSALAVRVGDLPRIKAYLDSDRRQDFSTKGVFRHYPELDPAD
jgi:glutathione S-transferase